MPGAGVNSTFLLIDHFSDFVSEHRIRRDPMFILQLVRGLDASCRNAIFESVAGPGMCAIEQGVREGEIRWQQTQLYQHGGLVPCDMLVIQSIPPDVDDGRKGDP